MSNNLMPEIAKLLGVEMGEKFKIQALGSKEDENSTLLVWLTEHGLCVENNYVCNDGENKYLVKALTGELKIFKLPWEPKEDEPYWTISFFKEHRPYAENYVWNGDDMDFIKLKLGMVYRTQAEAESHLAEDYKRLTGKPFSSLE